MPLTLQQRAHRIALANIAAITRALTTITEDQARHRHCGQCWRTRSDRMAIDRLLEDLLESADRRDVTAMDDGSQHCTARP